MKIPTATNINSLFRKKKQCLILGIANFTYSKDKQIYLKNINAQENYA
jgi:hypothetical protein